jgi:hypothetical protein
VDLFPVKFFSLDLCSFNIVVNPLELDSAILFLSRAPGLGLLEPYPELTLKLEDPFKDNCKLILNN